MAIETLPDMPARLAILERRVDRLFNWLTSAFFVGSLLGGGYLWFLSQQFEEWKKVRENTSQIATDLFIVKKEQERFSRESDRAWRLLNAIIKKGNSDVSSSQERD